MEALIGFGGITPIIPAHDMEASLAFYTGTLGFAEMWRTGNPVTQAGVLRENASVILFLCDEPRVAQWTAFRIRVAGIQALYEHCEEEKIIHPGGALCRQPWGAQEFTALDPSGVAITFWEP